MNIKISMHLMPWEVDHALLTFEILKKSSYYLEKDVIYIDTALNLSSYTIDWETSKLPKEFFIEKYKTISKLLDWANHKPFIYEGNELWGHLDLQQKQAEPHIDYYITICPDTNFSEHLLYYLIEYAKQIPNEYFILTPQIFKSWDSSWDILVNNKFQHIPYTECINIDIHKIRYQCLDLDSPSIKPIDQFKFAGWMDLYNKNFMEKLAPVLTEWKGYGSWDLYSMNICNIAKKHNVDIQQYVLENQVIWFSDTGCLRNFEEYGGDGQLKSLYKKFLTLKSRRQEQRLHIDQNLNYYLNKWFNYAKQTNIIK